MGGCTVTTKMRFKHIRFDEAGLLYSIRNNRSGGALGVVFWYAPWKQWCARFDENTVWSQDCLEDVRTFINSLPKE